MRRFASSAPILILSMLAAALGQLAAREPGPLAAAEERALKIKDSFKECRDCPELVVLPAGAFTMGSAPADKDSFPTETPRHKVTIARPLAVGKFEVTFDEWDACVAAGGCNHRPEDQGWGRGRRP